MMRDHARYERAGDLRSDLRDALLRSLFVPEPRLRVLLAIRHGEQLGYATWSLEASTWQGAEYAHLDCLYVREEARGQRIGRLLLHAVEEGARSAGATELQWQTPAWNHDAIRFYRRTGARGVSKIRYTLPLPGGAART